MRKNIPIECLIFTYVFLHLFMCIQVTLEALSFGLKDFF